MASEDDKNVTEHPVADSTDGFKSKFGFGKKKPPTVTDPEAQGIAQPSGDRTEKTTTVWYSNSSGVEPVDPKPSMSSNYEYDFTHTSRGVAHVFVNIEFDECTQQLIRPGAGMDMINFNKAFSQLKFKVERHQNCTMEQIEGIIQAYCRKSHDDEDCVVFAFSSHGDQKILKSGNLASDIIYCKDGFLQVSTITNMLSETNCPGMVNKPKLFFFQACRGDKLSETIKKTGDSDAQVISSQDLRNTDPVEIPLQKDYYIAFSAPPGFYSWRRSNGDKTGSWFVTALCDVIEESSGDSIDLVDLMTSVNHHIAIGRSKPAFISHVHDERFNNRMSVPWIASMLTKSVIFTRE